MHHKAYKRSRIIYTASAEERCGAKKTSEWREHVGLPLAAPLGASDMGMPEYNPKSLKLDANEEMNIVG